MLSKHNIHLGIDEKLLHTLDGVPCLTGDFNW